MPAERVRAEILRAAMTSAAGTVAEVAEHPGALRVTVSAPADQERWRLLLAVLVVHGDSYGTSGSGDTPTVWATVRTKETTL